MQPINSRQTTIGPLVETCSFEGLTLVIGHGRAHQIIRELDYDRSVFLDRDAKARPDIIADFRSWDHPAERGVPRGWAPWSFAIR